MRPYRQIRADYDRNSIVVYQAYGSAIADPAVATQRFAAPFSFERMTWIKPSFLWMMERCGWGQKSGQEHVLAVRITRAGWEEALGGAMLSTGEVRGAPVVVQWDPERNIRGGRLEYRSIQVGISRHLVRRYAEEWVIEIRDLSPLVAKLLRLRREGEMAPAERLLPPDRPYPVSDALGQRLGVSP